MSNYVKRSLQLEPVRRLHTGLGILIGIRKFKLEPNQNLQVFFGFNFFYQKELELKRTDRIDPDPKRTDPNRSDPLRTDLYST